MKQHRQLLLRLEYSQKMEYEGIEDFIGECVAFIEEDADHETVWTCVGHFAEEEEGGGRV